MSPTSLPPISICTPGFSSASYMSSRFMPSCSAGRGRGSRAAAESLLEPSILTSGRLIGVMSLPSSPLPSPEAGSMGPLYGLGVPPTMLSSRSMAGRGRGIGSTPSFFEPTLMSDSPGSGPESADTSSFSSSGVILMLGNSSLPGSFSTSLISSCTLGRLIGVTSSPSSSSLPEAASNGPSTVLGVPPSTL